MWKGERGTQSVNSSKTGRAQEENLHVGEQHPQPRLCPAPGSLQEHTGEGAFRRCDAGPAVCCHGSEGLDFLSSCVPSSALLGTVTASFFYSETVLEMTLPLAQNTERPHCFEATMQPNYMRGRFFISIPKISLLHVC